MVNTGDVKPNGAAVAGPRRNIHSNHLLKCRRNDLKDDLFSSRFLLAASIDLQSYSRLAPFHVHIHFNLLFKDVQCILNSHLQNMCQ